MRYLLYTNIVSALIRNPQGRVAQRIEAIGELPAEEIHGSIRTKLELAGTAIGGNDVLIGAQALTLASRW